MAEEESVDFDICLSFDDAPYLDYQAKLFISSIKDKLPKNTTIHIVTNRNTDDPVLKEFMETLPRLEIYFKEKDNNLKSRCRYMLNCFDIQTNKPWVVKMELDFVFLRNLKCLESILDEKYDMILEPENRKIFSDDVATRLWRIIYRAMGIEAPIHARIQFRENKEYGLPLIGTGLICIKSKHLKKISERWKGLTKICERWIDMNTHPNEMAFTGLIYDEGWNYKVYPDIYKYNPIGHFRKGDFPSQELIEDCKLPEDTVIFDYHRYPWLLHVSKYNPKLKAEIDKCNVNIDEEYLNKTIFSEEA